MECIEPTLIMHALTICHLSLQRTALEQKSFDLGSLLPVLPNLLVITSFNVNYGNGCCRNIVESVICTCSVYIHIHLIYCRQPWRNVGFVSRLLLTG